MGVTLQLVFFLITLHLISDPALQARGFAPESGASALHKKTTHVLEVNKLYSTGFADNIGGYCLLPHGANLVWKFHNGK